MARSALTPEIGKRLFWRKLSEEKQNKTMKKTGSGWNIWLLVITYCGRKKKSSE